MAYRELFVLEIKEVLRLWSRGRGFRTIAKRTSVDRKTVRRYVEAAQALGLSRDEDSRSLDDDLLAGVAAAVRPGAPSEPGRMREHCREHAELIQGWLDKKCRGPKVRKLLGRHTGVAVPLRTLQRFIAEELGQDGGKRDTVRVVDPEACEILEVDFLELGLFTERGTGLTRKMHALLCTAGYSRHQFVWPCLRQTQQDVIEGLEAAWCFFGGIFPLVVFDNLKAVVKVPDPVKPILTEDFLEYVQARDFEVDPARKRKATDKARVERQVQYVRNDYFRGEDFGSVEEARQEAVRWCLEDAGMRDHGSKCWHPLEVFEQEEKPRLEPAPTEPYDKPRWSDAHAGRDHAVVVDYALYTVPYTLGEVDLRARVDRSTVKLYLGARLVKVHPRQPRGGASIDPVDLPPGKAEAATRDGATLQRRAAIFGPHVGEYARRLLEGPLPWTRIRQVYRLNGLALRYGDLADEACERALELDVVDVTRIQRMLERGLVRRGLLSSRPPQPPPQRKVVPLRFARDPQEYRTRRSPSPGGDPDATA